jgi:hypothetical protein
MEIQRIKISELDRILLSAFMNERYPLEIDFNWLMPVVEKIGSMGYIVSIVGYNCRIEGDHILFTSKRYNKMQSTYETVIEFIAWYNKFMYKK